MPPSRPQVQPGYQWGPFTLRIPFIHLRAETPELLQGLLVANATGLAVVPLYAEFFGMPFETAIALVVLQSMIICSAFLLFGDPFCPGWLTPAIPLVLRETAAFETAAERIDFVNAVVLLTSAVFLVFGLTDLGRRFIRAIPRVVKAGVILGAGMSAFYGELIPRSGGRPARLDAYPWSIAIAVAVTLLLLFSEPVARLRRSHTWLNAVAGLGVAPGFALAMIAGPWLGEIDYASFFAYDGPAAFWPDFDGLFAGFSVLGRGLPPAELLIRALPLALAAYLIGFGDIITGTAILKDAQRERPDEEIPLDARRTHLTIGLRNGLVAMVGGPFFPLQGPLWTGATVVVAERWKRGRDHMQSLFSGVSSYYLFGLPLLYFIRPALELLRPALDVVFSLTLLVTGFACAYVALAMAEKRLERGILLAVGMAIMYFNTLGGMALGLALSFLLMGKEPWKSDDGG